LLWRVVQFINPFNYLEEFYFMNANFRNAFRAGLVMGISAGLTFAQSSPFGQAAQGVATEAISIVKWIGIVLCIICGIAVMVGGPGAMAKIGGLLMGLVLALFASPIVNWVQSL
jgi:type IV secretory pathway VirB2 component (pilin)